MLSGRNCSNREGGVLLGKFPTASRIKNTAKQGRSFPSQTLSSPQAPATSYPPAPLDAQAPTPTSGWCAKEGLPRQSPAALPCVLAPVLSGKYPQFSGTRSGLGFGLHFIDAIELKKWGDRHIETGRNEKTQRRKEGGERAGRVSDKGP